MTRKTRKRLSFFCLLILFLSILTACGRTDQPGKTERFRKSRAILHVDADYLIPATDITLIGVSSGKRFKRVVLQFAASRVSMIKLRTPHFGVRLSMVDIMKRDPVYPILFEAWMKSSALKAANRRYAETSDFQKAILLTGKNGFPFFFDLENYDLKKWAQETQGRVGSGK